MFSCFSCINITVWPIQRNTKLYVKSIVKMKVKVVIFPFQIVTHKIVENYLAYFITHSVMIDILKVWKQAPKIIIYVNYRLTKSDPISGKCSLNLSSNYLASNCDIYFHCTSSRCVLLELGLIWSLKRTGNACPVNDEMITKMEESHWC